MSPYIEITDPADTRLDDFRDLQLADRRPDRPGGRGLVIAEGVVVVRRLVASAYPVRALLGVQRRYAELADDLVATSAPYYGATAELMAQVVGFHLNRGVLATADRVSFPAAGELLQQVTTVAVLEGVGDHENLGAVFRNAAALGVGAVLLAAGCSDPLYRRSVRVSMGTVLAVPFAPVDWLARGYFVVAAQRVSNCRTDTRRRSADPCGGPDGEGRHAGRRRGTRPDAGGAAGGGRSGANTDG